ncbi:MAG: hypothetical protein B7Z02_15175 [Rhodobacterales bacterium 32-67-9]|nr:MAG: hypothetical protein B7Z02_15175 [Rhodobacterales bacterium 32-67-9]
MSDTDSDDDEAPQLIEVPQDSDRVIPVTILAGFLGSGKTTLLNHILTSNHGKRIAVIENEFGEGLGIESMIAKSGVDGDNISDFFELSNGCVSLLSHQLSCVFRYSSLNSNPCLIRSAVP